jgi:hypothetical protein
MKRSILFIILIFSMLLIPATAQESCDTAAANATLILDSALTLLEAGNIEGAKTLVRTARDSLATCIAGEPAIPPVQALPSAQPTQVTQDTSAAPEATAVPQAAPTATTSSTTTASSNDYVLTPPVLDLDSGIAFVRFAHTSVDAGPIDIYRGRDAQPIVAGLDYGEVTEMIPIPAGGWLMTARSAGTGGEQLYAVNWNYLANSTWVVAAAGIREEFAFIVEPVSILRNDYDGKARVRVINVVAGAPRTTVRTADGLALGDGLGWFGLRDTLLEPGDYILDANATNGSFLVTPQQFTFNVNTTYTLLVMGGRNGAPLEFLTFSSPQEISRVRFINSRIDVVDIHYRPGNQLLISTFDPQTETDWYEFPSGAITFIAVAPGAGANGREIAALPWQLRPDRDITVELSQNGMRVIETVLRGYED